MDPSSGASVGHVFVLIVVVCNMLFSSLEYRLLCTYGVGARPNVVWPAVLGLEALGISAVSRGIGLICLAMISFPLGGMNVFFLRLIAAPLSLRKSLPSISFEGRLSST